MYFDDKKFEGEDFQEKKEHYFLFKACEIVGTI